MNETTKLVREQFSAPDLSAAEPQVIEYIARLEQGIADLANVRNKLYEGLEAAQIEAAQATFNAKHQERLANQYLGDISKMVAAQKIAVIVGDAMYWDDFQCDGNGIITLYRGAGEERIETGYIFWDDLTPIEGEADMMKLPSDKPLFDDFEDARLEWIGRRTD